MIVNGSSNRCTWWWAKHLQSEENDNVRVVKSYGLRSDSIEAMLEEMMDLAQGTKCENPFYQMNINPAPGERLTGEDWERAREIAEKKHGFEGQPYFMVMHVKYGREHPHFIYSRIDIENMRAIPDSLDAKKNHAIAREIEREFGLEKTIGPYDREAGAPRPPRAPKKYEMYRDKQNGLDTRDIQAEVTELFQQSHDGMEFRAVLEEHGYRLATGRRGLLILDSAGKEHSLARRCGVPMNEVLSFMRDVDLKTVPTVEQAREQFQERKIAGLEADRATVRDEIEWHEALEKAAIEKEKIAREFVEPKERKTQAGVGSRKEKDRGSPQKSPAPELGKAQGEIRLARSLTDGPQGFANAIEDRGFILARVTADDIRREMARLKEEWEERRRNPQTWMEHEGGFNALKPEFQESALRSFDQWKKERDKDKDRGNAKKLDNEYTVEAYVHFVQGKWLEGPQSQLERANGGLAVITPFGSIYTLTPRNTGLESDELAEYLKGIDRAPLLSVTDAQAVIQDVRDHRREEWRAQQPIGKVQAEIRLAYSLTQTGQDFANAIEDRGLILARMTAADAGRLNRWERQRLKEEWAAPILDKTGKVRTAERVPEEKYRAGELVVVNQYGQLFQLTSANTGHDKIARAGRLKDIDFAPLLSVSAAESVMKDLHQHCQEERQEDRQRKRDDWQRATNERYAPTHAPQHQSWSSFEKAATDATRDDRTENLRGPAAKVWEAFTQSDSAKAFAAALDEKGIMFAAVTEEEAYRSEREAEFAKAVGNRAQRFKDGEIVLVTEQQREYRRDDEMIVPSRVHRIDPSLAYKFTKALDNRDKLQGIDATLKVSDERAQKRAAEWQKIRFENAAGRNKPISLKRVGKQASRATGSIITRGIPEAAASIGKAAGIAGSFGKALDVIGSMVESLAAPVLTPAQIYEGEKAKDRREAEADQIIDFSRVTAEAAQQHMQQESEREAARQRSRDEGRGRD